MRRSPCTQWPCGACSTSRCRTSHRPREPPRLLREPLDEAVLVRAREHRRQQDPPGTSDRHEEREVLAPVHRRALNELAAPRYPRMTAGRRGVEARLVDEDQAIWRYTPDFP